MVVLFFFFFKQKTAYEMRISDWSSDVCSSDLSRRSFRVSADVRHQQTRTQLAAHPLPVETGLGVETGKVLEVQALAIRRELRRADVLQVQQVVDLIRASRIDRARCRQQQIGRAHVCTPVNTAHIVCRILLEKKQLQQKMRTKS